MEMPATAAPPRILVVGSANLDIVVPVDRHPVRGETVLGGDHVLVPGGKGANQAVAASRLGGSVQFIGRLGADSAGEILRASLDSAGVITTLLEVDSDVPSGIALITVDPEGDNAIVVSPGANATLTPARVADDPHVRAAITNADVVLLQLETPIETVSEIARLATGVVILDPAPAPDAPLPGGLLEHVDIVVPNETELAVLAGVGPSDSIADITSAARTLGVETVVVTLGSRGAVVVTADDSFEVRSPSVLPIDTTGAGDAFRASLAVSLSSTVTLKAATDLAVRVGAATTLVAGAQPSMPTPAQVDERLDR